MQLSRRIRAWPVAAVLMLLASGPRPDPALADTLYVAQDGTGAYSVIQDALDAAAPGDTIRIGAGRYDQFSWVYDPPIADAEVVIHVPVSDLTMVGADRDSVFVGPEQHVGTVNGRVALGMLVLEGTVGTTISGVTLENTSIGATFRRGVHIVDCRVRGASEALIALVGTAGTVIEDSLFEWTLEHGQITAITSFNGQQVPDTVVRNCVFKGERGGGVQLDHGDRSIIQGCTFDGVNIGVWLITSRSVVIDDCTFAGTENATILVDDFSEAAIVDCVLGDALHRGIQVWNSTVTVERTAISGGDFGAIVLNGGVDVYMRDCDIFNPNGPRVYSESGALYAERIDLRYNYWGSQDSTEIAGWIEDGADDGPGDCTFSYCPRDTVEFWPVLDRSVPAQEQSVGGLKGRFRRTGSSGQD